MALFGRDEKDPKVDRPPSTVDLKMPPVAAPAKDPPREPARTPGTNAVDKAPTGDVVAEVNAFIGKGSRVSGKLHFDGTVRVEGQIEGEITTQDTLIVGERALITAQISGNTVVIRGKVTGDINARKRVELHAPGKLYGNLVTPSLVIHDGVIFEGHCSMGSENRSGDSKSPQPSREEKGGEGVLSR